MLRTFYHLCPNRAMTLFTSLGTSADCRGLTPVPIYQVRACNAHVAAFTFSPRDSSLSWGLQGKVVRTPHQSKGSGGTVCSAAYRKEVADHLKTAQHLGRLRRVKYLLAILAVVDGQSFAQVALVLRVHAKTVATWFQAFCCSGLQDTPRTKPPGRPPKLTPTQKAVLRRPSRGCPPRAPLWPSPSRGGACPDYAPPRSAWLGAPHASRARGGRRGGAKRPFEFPIRFVSPYGVPASQGQVPSPLLEAVVPTPSQSDDRETEPRSSAAHS